jgi:hypothetical protein
MAAGAESEFVPAAIINHIQIVWFADRRCAIHGKMALDMLTRTILLLVSVVSSSLVAQSQATSRNGTAELPDAPSFHAFSFLRLKSGGSLTTVPVSIPLNGDELEQLEGARAKLLLLSTISSKLPTGSPFQARLENAVMLNGKAVVPQGAVFEGHIETVHARRLMRRGTLLLLFDQVVLPSGERHPIHAYLASSDSPHMKQDDEGRLQPAWTHKRMALELGGTVLVGKLADDIAESAAADTIGAASARYVGLGASALFLALQKGPNAQLRPGTNIEVEFGRANAPMGAGHIGSPAALNQR